MLKRSGTGLWKTMGFRVFQAQHILRTALRSFWLGTGLVDASRCWMASTNGAGLPSMDPKGDGVQVVGWSIHARAAWGDASARRRGVLAEIALTRKMLAATASFAFCCCTKLAATSSFALNRLCTSDITDWTDATAAVISSLSSVCLSV